MDITRIVLGLGLAIVTYLLILAWNEDYDRPAQLPPTADQQGQAPGEVPADLDQRAMDDDLAVPPPVSPADQVATARKEPLPDEIAVADATGLIEVTTDTYELRIDPRGGDIVHAALRRYPLYVDTPEIPFVLLERGNGRTYVVQSGLVGRDGPDAAANGRPLYSSQRQAYRMEPGQDILVVDLRLDPRDGVRITKRFLFHRDEHRINVRYLIENQGNSPWQAAMFGQIKRDRSSDPSSSNAAMSMSTYLGPALFTPEKPYNKISFGDIDDESFRLAVDGGWVAMLQHYFISAWIPTPDKTHTYYTRKTRNGDYVAGFSEPVITVPPGQRAEVSAKLYVGPKVQEDLKELGKGLDLTVDYGWLWFIAQPLFWLLSFIHGFVGNWGWAIVIITLLIKLAFFQLSAASYRSMANMRRVQPEMARLKELYGDDRQKMSQEMMELYKREKINPLGGCLPILVQIPVFISLYWMLLESVELRHAPFMAWIVDLSVKDPYFVLPILMGATMFIQQMLNPAPPDPVQARIMRMLPVIFTFFFLWFPAGLVLYWLVNNVLSILQQWVITRNIENAAKARTA